MNILYVPKFKQPAQGIEFYNTISPGFEKHGDKLILCDVTKFKKYNNHQRLEKILKEYKKTDLLIGPAIYKKLIKPWDPHLREIWLKTNINYINIELGYLGNRQKNLSLGYNGINGEACFLNKNSPDDRWEKFQKEQRRVVSLKNHRTHPYGPLGYSIAPWKKEQHGDEVLIIEQQPGDCSLTSQYTTKIDMAEWSLKQKEKYINLGYKVRVRPRIKPGRSLIEDFYHAKFVVTCSSNCGVLAVLAGIPTIAEYPISMVYDICKETKTPNREQWIKDLLYCQWSIEEIKNGDAWDHLRKADFTSIINE